MKILGVDLSQPDKMGHLVLGGLVASTCSAVIGYVTHWNWLPVVSGLAAASILGLGKEFSDKLDQEHHTVDKLDALATFYGGVLGVVPAVIAWVVL